MYAVYLLLSLKFGIFYIGQTNNLLNRFTDHNADRSDFTKKKSIDSSKKTTERSNVLLPFFALFLQEQRK